MLLIAKLVLEGSNSSCMEAIFYFYFTRSCAPDNCSAFELIGFMLCQLELARSVQLRLCNAINDSEFGFSTQISKYPVGLSMIFKSLNF